MRKDFRSADRAFGVTIPQTAASEYVCVTAADFVAGTMCFADT